MKKNLLNLVLATSLLLGGLVGVSSCGGGGNQSQQVVKDKYTVTYNLNYGNKSSSTEVPNGGLATNRNVKRSGFEFLGWFTDKDGNNKYDFSTPVTSDLVLYACWVDQSSIVRHNVTFDLNYPNSKDVSLAVVSGQSIKSTDVPTVDRLGWVLDGWYTSETCDEGTEFDVEFDTITKDTKLYASYTRSTEITTDAQGNIVFNNVSINMVNNAGFGIRGSSTLNSLISEFNAAGYGIKVNLIEQTDANQNIISLKIHQTEHLNQSTAYYSAEEVFDLAGVEFDANDYHYAQIADNYRGGVLQSIPLVSNVPTIIYNKEIMEQYTNTIPTNVEDFYETLKTVNNTEKGKNTNWKGAIVIDDEWVMKEMSTHNFYIQNGAPFYEETQDGKLVNTWFDNGANGENMLTAVKQFQKLFVKSDAVGSIVSGYDNAAKAVGTGDALMAVVGVTGLYNDAGSAAGVSNSSIDNKIGVIPMSGFFATDKTNAWANKTFIKNFSFGVYKDGPKDLMKIAAAGVFANWVSEKAGAFTSDFAYPCHKDAIASTVGQFSIEWKTQVLQKVGSPENFMTYAGHINEYPVFNYSNENFMTTLINPDFDDTTLSNYISALANSIKGQIA